MRTFPTLMNSPIANVSNFELSELLLQVTNSGVKKGVKLDFKSTEVAEEGLYLAKWYQDQVSAGIHLVCA